MATGPTTRSGSRAAPGKSTQQKSCIEEILFEVTDREKPHPIHPTQVGKILIANNFQEFSEISKIGKFRFKIYTSNSKALKSLKLASYNLKLFIPKIKDSVLCFVKGVPTDLEEDEIKDNIQSDCEILSIERVKRLDEEKNLKNTANLKIKINGIIVPNRVKIFGCFFKTELYVFPVRQCQKCWRYGHSSKYCNAKDRCVNCGGEHTLNECNKTTKCSNCRQQHVASSSDCPERKRRQDILKEMKRRTISYSEAEKIFPKLTNRFSVLNEEEAFPSLTHNSQVQPQQRLNYRHRRNASRKNSTESMENLSCYGQSFSDLRKEKVRSDGNTNFSENTYRATDFERIMHELRLIFLAEIRKNRWVDSLKELLFKITNHVQGDGSDLDRDHIIIEIGKDIQNIINACSEHHDERERITNDSHSVV